MCVQNVSQKFVGLKNINVKNNTNDVGVTLVFLHGQI